MRHLDSMRALLWPSVTVWVAQLGDLTTTALCARVPGLIEANPIAAAVMAGYGLCGFAALKLLVWPIVFVALLWGSQFLFQEKAKHRLLVWTCAVTATVIFSAASISNYTLLRAYSV